MVAALESNLGLLVHRQSQNAVSVWNGPGSMPLS
jgi:hypothetical protein